MNILMGIWEKNCLNIPLLEPTGIFKILLMKKKSELGKKYRKKEKKRKKKYLQALVLKTPYFTKVEIWDPERLTHPTSRDSMRQVHGRQWVETMR